MASSTNPKWHNHPTLGESINIATRSVHTRLNKNILSRMPLALPPYVNNPSVYVSGLLHVAPIYLTFESLWLAILESPPSLPQKGGETLDNDRSPIASSCEGEVKFDDCGPRPVSDDRIRSILSHMYMPGLMRWASLRLDIASITGWSEDVVEEQLKAATTGRLAEFVAHTKRSVDNRPHVLLAYAWVLYMALFSGGRFIRATLVGAGPEFWGRRSDPVLPSERECEDPVPAETIWKRRSRGQSGQSDETERMSDEDERDNDNAGSLEFFRFNTPTDGEDLKVEFKRRLAEKGALLTDDEHRQVIQEAICIFENMNLLVSQLDDVFQNSKRSSSGASSLDSWSTMLVPRFLGGRLRNSVAVARERGLRALDRYRGSSSGWSDADSVGENHVHPGAERLNHLTSSSSSSSSLVELSTSPTERHAQGTLTSTTELLPEITIALQEACPLNQADKSIPPHAVKVVRFGTETAMLNPERAPEKKSMSAASCPARCPAATCQTEPLKERDDNVEPAEEQTAAGAVGALGWIKMSGAAILTPSASASASKVAGNLCWNVAVVLGVTALAVSVSFWG